MFHVKQLSSHYIVQEMTAQDLALIYELAVGNPQYYQYCPPFVTRESILADMNALPPGKNFEDKFYIGFYEKEKLIAVMDVILHFPNEQSAYIGFFMMAFERQGRGIGSEIVRECTVELQREGYSLIRLAYAKGNRQSEAFWRKNGFSPTGEEYANEGYTAVVLQREL